MLSNAYMHLINRDLFYNDDNFRPLHIPIDDKVNHVRTFFDSHYQPLYEIIYKRPVVKKTSFGTTYMNDLIFRSIVNICVANAKSIGLPVCQMIHEYLQQQSTGSSKVVMSNKLAEELGKFNIDEATRYKKKRRQKFGGKTPTPSTQRLSYERISFTPLGVLHFFSASMSDGRNYVLENVAPHGDEDKHFVNMFLIGENGVRKAAEGDIDVLRMIHEAEVNKKAERVERLLKNLIATDPSRAMVMNIPGMSRFGAEYNEAELEAAEAALALADSSLEELQTSKKSFQTRTQAYVDRLRRNLKNSQEELRRAHDATAEAIRNLTASNESHEAVRQMLNAKQAELEAQERSHRAALELSRAELVRSQQSEAQLVRNVEELRKKVDELKQLSQGMSAVVPQIVQQGAGFVSSVSVGNQQQMDVSMQQQGDTRTVALHRFMNSIPLFHAPDITRSVTLSKRSDGQHELTLSYIVRNLQQTFVLPGSPNCTDGLPPFTWPKNQKVPKNFNLTAFFKTDTPDLSPTWNGLFNELADAFEDHYDNSGRIPNPEETLDVLEKYVARNKKNTFKDGKIEFPAISKYDLVYQKLRYILKNQTRLEPGDREEVTSASKLQDILKHIKKKYGKISLGLKDIVTKLALTYPPTEKDEPDREAVYDFFNDQLVAKARSDSKLTDADKPALEEINNLILSPEKQEVRNEKFERQQKMNRRAVLELNDEISQQVFDHIDFQSLMQIPQTTAATTPHQPTTATTSETTPSTVATKKQTKILDTKVAQNLAIATKKLKLESRPDLLAAFTSYGDGATNVSLVEIEDFVTFLIKEINPQVSKSTDKTEKALNENVLRVIVQTADNDLTPEDVVLKRLFGPSGLVADFQQRVACLELIILVNDIQKMVDTLSLFYGSLRIILASRELAKFTHAIFIVLKNIKDENFVVNKWKGTELLNLLNTRLVAINKTVIQYVIERFYTADTDRQAYVTDLFNQFQGFLAAYGGAKLLLNFSFLNVVKDSTTFDACRNTETKAKLAQLKDRAKEIEQNLNGQAMKEQLTQFVVLDPQNPKNTTELMLSVFVGYAQTFVASYVPTTEGLQKTLKNALMKLKEADTVRHQSSNFKKDEDKMATYDSLLKSDGSNAAIIQASKDTVTSALEDLRNATERFDISKQRYDAIDKTMFHLPELTDEANKIETVKYEIKNARKKILTAFDEAKSSFATTTTQATSFGKTKSKKRRQQHRPLGFRAYARVSTTHVF